MAATDSNSLIAKVIVPRILQTVEEGDLNNGEPGGLNLVSRVLETCPRRGGQVGATIFLSLADSKGPLFRWYIDGQKAPTRWRMTREHALAREVCVLDELSRSKFHLCRSCTQATLV